MDSGNLTEREMAGVCLGDGEKVVATYDVGSHLALEQAADAIALEQSLGTRNVSADHARAFGATVVSVSPKPWPEGSPGDGGRGDFGSVEIAFPPANLASIPALLVALAGEALETTDFSHLRLTSLALPSSWLEGYAGPSFGIEGIRSILGVTARPLVVAILKPSVGLEPAAAADLAASLARGGADVIKDDELSSSVAEVDPLERARAVSDALAWVESETMKPKAYAANITGEIERLPDLAESLSSLGNVWPMLCDQAVGLDAVRVTAAWSARPIFCHRAYAGGLIRGGPFGVDSAVIAGLTRIAGGDLVHCGGLGGKLFDTSAGLKANVTSCLDPLGSIARALPIMGGGYWAGSVAPVRRVLATDDFAFVFGSGVTDHPMGAEAGVRSVMAALEADLAGEGFETLSHLPEVSEAVERFGDPWKAEDLGV